MVIEQWIHIILSKEILLQIFLMFSILIQLGPLSQIVLVFSQSWRIWFWLSGYKHWHGDAEHSSDIGRIIINTSDTVSSSIFSGSFYSLLLFPPPVPVTVTYLLLNMEEGNNCIQFLFLTCPMISMAAIIVCTCCLNR